MPAESPLLGGLLHSVACYPEHPAILLDGETISHRHFGELTDVLAASLEAAGLEKGDRVGLYCPNEPEFPLHYVAILKAGGVVVPINLLISPREIVYILADAGVRFLWVHPSLRDRIEDLRGKVDSLEHVWVIDAEARKAGAGVWPEPDGTQHRAGSAADLAVILYTSGTTGFPKGAMLTHGNLAANVLSVRQAMRWQAGEDRVLVVLPLFHAFAATVGMLTPLSLGCALIPLPRFEPEALALAARRHRATLFLGVPSLYGVLMRLRDDQVGCFASLRCAIVGGAAMPARLLHQFEERFGIRLYEGDGPTECSPVTCVNPIGGLAKPGTVGLPVPGVEMKIIDESGRELPADEVGEIAVRGANVMLGYWNQPEATAEVFRDGWFLTGDLGTRDEDGYFSIVDRKKDLIIVNGMNVYPRMIEEVLHEHPDIREAAVVGESSDRHGELPVAYVVAHVAGSVTGRALRDHCRRQLGRHQVPRRFVFLAELPRNAAGKILKRELCRLGELERGVRGPDA